MQKIRIFFLMLIAVICVILSANNSFAKHHVSSNLKKQYFDWGFFKNKQGPKDICYITAVAVKKSGKAQNRGEPYFIITKTAGQLPEISLSSGYYYKEDSEVELSFNLRKFYLLTYKSKAWTYSVDDDIEIIKAMRDSDSLAVKGISDINVESQDIYSLIGFEKAYKAMQEECY